MSEDKSPAVTRGTTLRNQAELCQQKLLPGGGPFIMAPIYATTLMPDRIACAVGYTSRWRISGGGTSHAFDEPASRWRTAATTR